MFNIRSSSTANRPAARRGSAWTAAVFVTASSFLLTGTRGDGSSQTPRAREKPETDVSSSIEGQFGESQSIARQPMLLGAASNFSQGRQAGLLQRSAELPISHFRDGISWRSVERERGRYRFDHRRAQYPARLADVGGDLVLTINWGNRLYDGGATPHTPDAVSAFGRFAAEMVREYPAISAVEVGNEFNSANFVKGPVRQAGIAERGRYHLALVRSVAGQVRAVRPEVRILGGATHSIPAGYLWPILEEAGPGVIDAIALHPYKTPIDQLAAQIGVLRSHPAAATMPIDITEFGSKDPETAADHLLRGYATLAGLGVNSLYWYPLNDRGDGFVPLVGRDGEISGAGKAFRYIQQRLAGKIVRDVSPDQFTKVYQFADDTLVLWGEPREISLQAAGLVPRNAKGEELAGELMLNPDRAIVIEADGPARLGEEIKLGCSALVADSFYDFTYPGQQPVADSREQFRSYVLAEKERIDWQTLPGQQRSGVPWVPYLGLPGTDNFRLTADSIWTNQQRTRTSNRVVHEFMTQRSRTLWLEANFSTSGRNALNIAIDSEADKLWSQSGSGELDWSGSVNLTEGTPLRITTHFSESGSNRQGSRRSSSASRAAYRLRLFDYELCPTRGRQD